MKKVFTLALGFLFLAVSSCTSKFEKDITEQNSKRTTAYIDVPDNIEDLLIKNTCIACHDANKTKVGPSFRAIAQKGYSPETISKLIFHPNPNNWPSYPEMMVVEDLDKKEVDVISRWIAGLK